MKCNQAGIRIIKKYEALKLMAYYCPAKILTIGWGHTGPDVKSGMQISEHMADLLLEKDLEKFEAGISLLLKRKVTENQFSALVCLVFNIGLEAFQDSTLLLKLNSGAPLDHCGTEFLRWNKSKGKVLNGLTKRRQEERDLFLS